MHLYTVLWSHAHTCTQCSSKMKPYAIALSWLGVQAPTAEVHVVLEVPSEMDEGKYN